MAQLTCHNLALGYEGTEIISDLSFHVSAGDYLCIAPATISALSARTVPANRR